MEVSHVAVPDAEHSSAQLGEWVHAKPRMLWWAGVHGQDLSPTGRAYGTALAAQVDRKDGLGVCEGVFEGERRAVAFQGDDAIFFFHRPLLPAALTGSKELASNAAFSICLRGALVELVGHGLGDRMGRVIGLRGRWS